MEYIESVVRGAFNAVPEFICIYNIYIYIFVYIHASTLALALLTAGKLRGTWGEARGL